MREEPKKGTRAWILWAALLLLAYLLLQEPADTLAQRAYHRFHSEIPLRVVTYLYAPVEWARKACGR
jgi:hypothetical protein